MISPASLGDFTTAAEGTLSHALSAALKGESVMFDSISIDSRTIKKGDLFIAIRGEDFDGHQFVSEAIARGCCAVVIERGSAIEHDQNIKRPVLIVNNTQKALGVIAAGNRDKFKGQVIGLTGSSGKTTTKNMLTSILSRLGPTCATEGNRNNEIGVPLTLLNINSDHKYAVVEMGARSKGDIHYLGQFVKPDVALLLNAGSAHIDIFGSYEAIVSAKGEIYETLLPGGTAIVNADDLAAPVWISTLGEKKILRYSMKQQSVDVWAEDIDCQADVSTYILHVNDQQSSVTIPVPGHHNVMNSLAAAAAATAAGVDVGTIALGLQNCENDTGRLQFIHLPGDLVLIDDSYNANPASMQAALDVLSLRGGKKTAVLGEMAELGLHAEALHQKVARYAASTSIDAFYLMGAFAEQMAECIGHRAKVFSDKQVLANELCMQGVAGESILVKGSRVMAMNDIVDSMVAAMKGEAH